MGPLGSRRRWDVAQAQLLLFLIGGAHEGVLLLSLHHPAPFLALQNLLTVSLSEAFNWRKLDVTHQLPAQPKPDKGSLRGALSPGPQKASATSPRKRGTENAVVHFFRTIVTPAPPKSRWREIAAKMSLGDQKSQSAKAKKAAAGDSKGTLTRIFKMVTFHRFFSHFLGNYKIRTIANTGCCFSPSPPQ
ncbi:hypothetical protein D4764_10G0006120 [Takifugu flavidus]|uniref:Uncharacterized protein n=1 Tax=Takifugu flavidus TaxID=433684 RepID=A0A5C6PIE7_9TELE|nr:hypothetical protein D4764_10G0006120 [Takifugu flavidus]